MSEKEKKKTILKYKNFTIGKCGSGAFLPRETNNLIGMNCLRSAITINSPGLLQISLQHIDHIKYR